MLVLPFYFNPTLNFNVKITIKLHIFCIFSETLPLQTQNNLKFNEETTPMADSESEDFSLLSVFKYKCSYAGCDLEFRRKDRLDSHEFTHSQVKKFVCTETDCGKAYVNNSHLQRHIRAAHAKTNEIIHCPHESCAMLFASEVTMKTHCRTIHSEKLRDFICEICNEKFRRKTHLKQHMFEHTGSYIYKCDECGEGFLLMSRLKRHKNAHKTRQCDHCAATFDKWSLLLAHKQKDHLNIQLKCSICNKEFHSRRSLKSHCKIHANPDDRLVYPCSFEGCPKQFLQNKNMLAHYKAKHENVKFVCTHEDCKSELSTKQKLTEHIKVVHLGERNKKSKKKKTQTVKTQRKDKGVQKTSTASKIFKIILPPEFERAILSGQGKNLHISYDRMDNEDDDHGNGNADFESKILDVPQLNAVNLTEGIVKG